MKLIYSSLFLAALCPAFAQNVATLAAAGYSAPAALQVAPGQVVTLFFRGVGPLAGGQFRSGQASTVPLPATIAGLSARISQPRGPFLPIPIFAVRQEDECDGSVVANPACLLTSVKVQIPFEIVGDITASATGAFTYAPLAQFTLRVDDEPSRTFPLQPVPDNAHVLTSCDVNWDTATASVCDRHIYHGDGTVVSEANSAKRGETVVVYAFGLGHSSFPVRTGDVSPPGQTLTLTGAPNYPSVKARFESFVNALSSVPRFTSSDDINSPGSPISFAGLTGGQIGLYQLNIPIPQNLDLFGPCNASSGGSVRGNATLRITTSQGTEVTALCIQP
jgi:hypothetical protein